MVFFTFRAEVMMDDSNSREPVNWRQCILSQESNTSKGAVIVMNLMIESYQKILDMVAERGSVHDGQYIAIQRRFKGCTKEMLVDKEVTWRRSCYSYATNQTELQRARGRFEHSVATGQYSYEMKRRGHKRSTSEMEADIPGTSKPFTRSATDRLSRVLCFFCQIHSR